MPHAPVYPDAEAWYCLRAQPKREKVAASHLRTLPGVSVFLPMVRYQKKGCRGPVDCIEPIFPGYLFARFVPLLTARHVRYTQGVGGILKRGDALAAVDDAIIAELLAVTDDGLLDLPERALEIGEKVKIVAGIFSHFDAEVLEIQPSRQRVKVLIELLGRPNPVNLDVAQLERHYINPLKTPG